MMERLFASLLLLSSATLAVDVQCVPAPGLIKPGMLRCSAAPKDSLIPWVWVLDGQVLGSGDSVIAGPLSQGDHILALRAQDSLGNEFAAYTYQVDGLPPNVDSATIRMSLVGDSLQFTAEGIQDSYGVSRWLWKLGTQAPLETSVPSLKMAVPADGDYKLLVRASDGVGNLSGVVPYSWKMDRTAPALDPQQVRISGQRIGSVLSSDSVTVALGHIPDASGIKAFQAELDGKSIAMDSSTLVLRAMGEGTHVLVVSATDSAGNQGKPLEISWRIDRTAPALRACPVFAPVPQGPGQIQVHLNFSEAVAEPLPQIALGAIPLKIRRTGDSALIAEADLSTGMAGSGVLPLHLDAVRDSVGNVAASNSACSLQVDLEAPVLDSRQVRYDGKGVQVDSLPEGTRLQFSIDGKPMDFQSSAFLAGSQWSEGQHTVQVVARDPAGNRSAPARLDFLVDRTAPMIDPSMIQVNDSDGKHPVRSDSVWISWTAQPDPSGIRSWEFRLDGNRNGQVTDTRILLDSLAEGPHVLELRGTDSAGNRGTPVRFAFAVDRKAPVLQSCVPDRAEPLGPGSVQVKMNFSEALDWSSAPLVSWSGIRGSVVRNADSVATAEFPLEPGKVVDGRLPLTIDHVTDMAGNRLELASSCSLWVDLTPPQLEASDFLVDGAKGRMLLAKSSASLRMDSAVQIMDLAYLEYRVGQGAFRKVASREFRIDSLPEGETHLAIRAVDAAGNQSAPVPLVLRVDRTPPRITAVEPSRTAPLGVGPLTLRIHLDGPVLADSAAILTMGDLYRAPLQKISDTVFEAALVVDSAAGFRQEQVRLQHVHDSAGNEAEASSTLLVLDTRAPELDSLALHTSPQGRAVRSGRIVFSSASAKDDSPVRRYWFRADTAKAVESHEPSWTFDSLPDGRHQLWIRAEDAAGNISRPLSVVVWVDTHPPEGGPVVMDALDSTRGTLILRTHYNEAILPDSSLAMSLQGSRLSSRVDGDSSMVALLRPTDSMDWERVMIQVGAVHDLAGNAAPPRDVRLEPDVKILSAYGGLLESSRPLAAAAVYQYLRKQSPQDTEVRKALVRIYRNHGDSLAEEKELAELTGFFPWDTAQYRRLSELALKRKDIPTARVYLAGLLLASGKPAGSYPDGYAREARPFYQITPPAMAVPQDAPMEAQLFLLDAANHVEHGNFSAAREAIASARAFSDMPSVQVASAALLLQMGMDREAKAVLDSTDGIPESAHGLQAAVLARNGADTAALALLDRPVGATDLCNRGVLLAWQGRSEEGVASLRRAADAAPQDPRPKVYLGFALIAGGHEDEARSVFLALPDSIVQRDYPEVYYGLSLCDLKQRDSVSAGVELAAALAIKSHYLDALLRLGELRRASGDLDAASRIYEKVLVLEPANSVAKSGLAGVYLGRGDSTSAAKMAREAVQARRKDKDPNAMQVAVLQFQNLTENPDLKWLQIGAAEAVTADMQNFSDYQMVERVQVEIAIRKLAMAQAFDESRNGAEVARMTGARGLVMGSFQGGGNQIRLDARLVDTETGKILATGTATGRKEDLPKLERELSLSLAGLVGNAEYEQMSGLASLSAQQKLAEAQAFLYQGDKKKAKQLSEEALKIDPHVLSVMDEAVLVGEDEASGKILAVFPFSNSTGHSEDNWLVGGVQEALITDLKKIGGLYMVERSQVNKVLEEQSLGETGLVDESSAPKLGKMMSAGVAIMGGFQTVGDQIRIHARMVDVEKGEVYLATDVKGPSDKVLDLEEQLALKILEALNVNISTYEQRKIVEKDPLALKTLRSDMEKEQSDKEWNQRLEQYQKLADTYGGKILLAGSVATTVVAGGITYMHVQDRSDYENASDPDDAVRAGDRAETSYQASVIAIGVSLFSWAVTGGWYAWKAWFHNDDSHPPEKTAQKPAAKKSASLTQPVPNISEAGLATR